MSQANIHFWIIFVRGDSRWGWRAYSAWSNPNSPSEFFCCYKTVADAKQDLQAAKKLYGEARLYKFTPEAFILGACK